MGVVDFDPEKWLRANSDGDPGQAAKDAKPAKVEPALATLATLAGDRLPADLRDGLRRLQSMKPPNVTRPQVWCAVVADAVRLAADGWASQALSLGWPPLSLWGCSPTIGGNPDHDGLAVWLDGRRTLLLDERACIVDAGAGARAVFTRQAAMGAVLLWDLARLQ
ncbi:MAG: hypothetical protein ACR2JJ_04610 [Sphingomicrobium sp.]